MKKKPVKLKFKISLDEFFTEMMKKIGFIKRDKEQFASYNVTESEIDKVVSQLEEFAEMPTDDELLGDQMNSTAEKDKAVLVLRDRIDEVMSRADLAFGTGTGKYRKFGVNGVSKLDGGELSVSARRVFRVANGFIDDLTKHGLTPEMLAALETDRKHYDLCLEKQEDAIADREIATESRTEKANAIYALISKYCATGRKIWEDNNQARYNDYIIYDAVTSQDTSTGE